MSQRKSHNYRAWQIANKGRARRARLLEQHRVRQSLKRHEHSHAEEQTLFEQVKDTAGRLASDFMNRIGARQ